MKSKTAPPKQIKIQKRIALRFDEGKGFSVTVSLELPLRRLVAAPEPFTCPQTGLPAIKPPAAA